MSLKTVKRLLRRSRLRWKRVRRSLRGQRNEELFRAAHGELERLREESRLGVAEFELWYFDEAGFGLTPCVPYAWQPIGERIELPSLGNQRQRQNVLGFVRWDGGDFFSAAFEGNLNNHLVAGCFHLFAAEKKSSKPKLVVIDNAPAHRGDEFEQAIEELSEQGVFLMYLPAYSPELNLIELLWKKIKYEWLPLNIYQNFKTMSEGLFEVLKGVGSKYPITFV